MNKVLLVMHDSSGSFYRMNKTAFETMPVAGQYIYNSDGLEIGRASCRERV